MSPKREWKTSEILPIVFAVVLFLAGVGVLIVAAATK